MTEPEPEPDKHIGVRIGSSWYGIRARRRTETIPEYAAMSLSLRTLAAALVQPFERIAKPLNRFARWLFRMPPATESPSQGEDHDR